MLLTLLALVVGAAVGLVQRSQRGPLDLGAWRPWQSIEQRWLLAGGIAVQAVAETFDVPARRSLLVIGLFAVVVALAGNLFRLAGAGVTIVGIAANLAALVANGHVPVRLEALIGAGIVPADVDPATVSLNGGLAVLADDTTRFGFLGDIVPLGIFDDVVSFGDLIVLAGLGIIARSLAVGVPLRPASRRPHPRRSTTPTRSCSRTNRPGPTSLSSPTRPCCPTKLRCPRRPCCPTRPSSPTRPCRPRRSCSRPTRSVSTSS